MVDACGDRIAAAEMRRALLSLEGLRLASELADASSRLSRAGAMLAACEAAFVVAESGWESAARAARFDEGVGPEALTVSALELGRAERLAAERALKPKMEEASRAQRAAAVEFASAEAEELLARQALERHQRVVGRRESAGGSGESG